MRVTIKYNRFAEHKRKMDRAIEEGLSDGASRVQGTAMAIVAVDTGRLRASIRQERIRHLVYQVYTDVNYAIYVERGTRYQQAQPYMRPAFERHYREILADLQRRMATVD